MNDNLHELLSHPDSMTDAEITARAAVRETCPKCGKRHGPGRVHPGIDDCARCHERPQWEGHLFCRECAARVEAEAKPVTELRVFRATRAPWE